MSKFHKLQKFSSVIPFLSTVLVAIITTIELKRHAASKRVWAYFILTFLLTGIIVYLVNGLIMTGQNPLLNVVASALILAVANILFVDFQIMSIKAAQTEVTTNKKLYIIICCVTLVLIAIALPLFFLFSTATNIEDTNGSTNTDLAIITQDEILSSDNSSEYAAFTSYKGTQTNVTGRMEKYDYQNCTFSCDKISGVKTIQVTKTDRSQLTLNVSSLLEEGNMEIVIIIDGEYYDHVPINQNSSIVLSDIANKTVVVKMGAESAKVKISINRQIN